LRHYAASLKVTGSSPEEVIAIFFFSIYVIFPAALGLGVYSASNRYEYQKQKNNASGEWSAVGRLVRLTTPPYLSRLSKKYASLDD
jgi:hypothetical protein